MTALVPFWHTKGPPESPWHASLPPTPGNPAHILTSLILPSTLYDSLHLLLGITGAVTHLSMSDVEPPESSECIWKFRNREM